MYSPSYNQLENRAELVQFMHDNAFALVITGTGGALHASHLPVMLEERDGAIFIDSHMARANPQWKEFFDDEILLVFHGAHAYVSPRWYAEKQRVPTWNYAAVHAYGVPVVIDDKAHKAASQRRLIAQYDPEWLPSHDALSKDYLDNMLEGIVNFQVRVTRLETRWKLSQNRGNDEMARIAEQLAKSDDSAARAVAELTRRHIAQG